jgi:hypothetical protein
MIGFITGFIIGFGLKAGFTSSGAVVFSVG